MGMLFICRCGKEIVADDQEKMRVAHHEHALACPAVRPATKCLGCAMGPKFRHSADCEKYGTPPERTPLTKLFGERK